MPVVDVDVVRVPSGEGVELNVRIWDGARAGGGGVGFLLVHGLSSNARLWDGVGRRLAELGHFAVALDQRGHGLSSKPDDGYDFTTLSDDLLAVARHTGLDRPVVAGQSWGANVVLDHAVQHPDAVRGVAAIDGATGNLRNRFPTWEECATALAPPELTGLPFDRIAIGVRRRHPDWPESGIEGALACYEVRDDGTVAPWLTRDRHMRILRELWAHRPTDLYPRLPMNALLAPCEPRDEADRLSARIRGKRAAVERIAASHRRVRVHWFHADHDVHAQHPNEVADLLHTHVDEGFFA